MCYLCDIDSRPENAPFLESIRLADSRDLSARLIYADWLEEHDESDRAELIRLAALLRDHTNIVDDYDQTIQASKCSLRAEQDMLELRSLASLYPDHVTGKATYYLDVSWNTDSSITIFPGDYLHLKIHAPTRSWIEFSTWEIWVRVLKLSINVIMPDRYFKESLPGRWLRADLEGKVLSEPPEKTPVGMKHRRRHLALQKGCCYCQVGIPEAILKGQYRVDNETAAPS